MTQPLRSRVKEAWCCGHRHPPLHHHQQQALGRHTARCPRTSASLHMSQVGLPVPTVLCVLCVVGGTAEGIGGV